MNAILRLAVLPAVLMALPPGEGPIAPAAAAPACSALLNRSLTTIDGKPRSLCDFAGQVMLVVNTASQCGYTPQYEGLEALYRKYQSQGFVVLGFPMNDFGGQEPGSNKQIAEFCVNQYAIEFPMFEKTSLRGPSANPLYADLAKATGKSPQWNFHKYLVGRDGKTVTSFETSVEPSDRRLVGAIEKSLAAR